MLRLTSSPARAVYQFACPCQMVINSVFTFCAVELINWSYANHFNNLINAIKLIARRLIILQSSKFAQVNLCDIL